MARQGAGADRSLSGRGWAAMAAASETRGGFDRAADGLWQRSLRHPEQRETHESVPLRGPGTVEAALLRGQRSRNVAADFAALAAAQDVRASQLQHELDMLRGRKTDATGREPILAAGEVDVGRFLSRLPTFQPELQDMEGYLHGRQTQPEQSPVRRVAVDPAVSPAVKQTPEEAQALQDANDWREKAKALLHAADSASAAATALTSTAEAIAATLPGGVKWRPSVVEFPAPEPAYDPRQYVPDAAEFTTAAAAMMAGPTAPAPARPGTSHGRGRRPDAMAPPMIAADEYDEELHRIAHYEKTRGPITSTAAPVPDELPGQAWHGDDNQDDDAAFTMDSPDESETDEDEVEEFYRDSQTVSFGQPAPADVSRNKAATAAAAAEINKKPPGLSVPVATTDSAEEHVQSDSDVNDEPGLGQVSPGTPPATVVQAWRDEDDSLLPSGTASETDEPAVAPMVAKVSASPSRSQRAHFRAIDTENGHAAVLSSLKTLGVSSQVQTVIDSTENVLDELISLRQEVKTLKQRLASERRARVEGAAREALLQARLHVIQGALPPVAADVEEMTRFYSRVAPGYAATDKPAKVVKYFHRKAQKEDRGTEWRQYMCESLAERWGQPAFDLLDSLTKRIGVDAPSKATQRYNAIKARADASDRVRTLAQPTAHHVRKKSQGADRAKPQRQSQKNVAAASGSGAALPPEKLHYYRPVGAAASTKIPTGAARSRMRGQRKAADRAAAVGRVGKPPPEELFFGGFGATNHQVSVEADNDMEYRQPTDAHSAEMAASEMQQQVSGLRLESPVRGWDGTPHRSSTVQTADMARADAEAALDMYVESHLADASAHRGHPDCAQYDGTWRYSGQEVMARLQLERDGDAGVGSALLGVVGASVNAASLTELPLDAPQQEFVGVEGSKTENEPSLPEKKPVPVPEPEPQPVSGFDDAAASIDDDGLMGALGDLLGALRKDPDAVLNHSGECV